MTITNYAKGPFVSADYCVVDYSVIAAYYGFVYEGFVAAYRNMPGGSVEASHGGASEDGSGLGISEMVAEGGVVENGGRFEVACWVMCNGGVEIV